jgi:hypothetical protein
MFYLRKLFAIILILFAFYLFLPSLSTGFQSLSFIVDLTSNPLLRTSGNYALAVLYVVGDLLFLILIVILLRVGYRIFREKKQPASVKRESLK